ncbi:MAG: TIGR03986 family CRISPR-associated RAMP protein [Firmicutes bacterium]|nr:TIGR03986 family CRISPR-associated RAMP protein [Bacillota bacterium]
MVRNLVEIASWSKFNFFDDKVLYYRRLADTSSLGKEYQNNMAPYDRQKKSSVYKFNAGYLAKDGFKYLIVPAKKENGKQFMQLKKKNSDEFVVEKRQDGKYLVISGKMEGKKHDWLINEPDLKAEKIPVPKEDIRAYENDDNRYVDKKNKDDFMKKDGNLLRLLNIGLEKLVPCFYVLWKDTSGRERVSFGHTGYFRLAYKKSVGDHIPEHISKANLIDMTDAIFGKEAEFAGRVFFEDAVLVPGHNNIYMDEVSPKILSGPKATTFQHYLEQKTSNVKTLSHWNSPDADIRGNKMYWHKNINDNELSWREEVVNPDTQHTVIRPVRPLLKFVGRIRFENLSEEELGALLFVLALPGNHYHKLGMGKPLGLGSVKITPKLIITSRLERYLKLFSGEGWALAEKPGVIDAFITQFEQYIMEHLRHSNSNDLGNAKTLWDTERLRQLKCMLDWQNTVIPGWSEKTRYMEIEHPNPQARNGTENEYKNRPVLPDPEKVVKT